MLPTPVLTLVSAQLATTYVFRVVDRFGWANCTVNDTTGELSIQSDWGSWSYRWSPRPECLGAPTLTVFIGTRSDVDYLARKLQREGRDGQRWSSVATLRALRRKLLGRRLKDGREQLEYRLEPWDMPGGQPLPHLRWSYTAAGLPILSHRMRGYDRLEFLTRTEARRIWDELGELADEVGDSFDLYYERIGRIDGFFEYITEEPWEYGETEQTPQDRALREIVLPALISACRRTVDGATSIGATSIGATPIETGPVETGPVGVAPVQPAVSA